LICSNLDDFSVARAVTASSAVPLLFPSVVLENHSDQCTIDKTPIGLQMQRMAVAEETPLVLRSTLESYRNRNERPYIHLVDGGITDNLGVRAVMDRLITLGYQPGINDPFTQFD